MLLIKNTILRSCFKLVNAIFILILSCLILGCGSEGTSQNNGNMPYEPDTPAPEPHKGVFTSEHGSMTFSGDGSHVTIDFDKELSECLGIHEGKQEAEYEFLSGYLPPHGEVPVRYDVAHIFKLYNAGDGTSEFSSEIEIGLYEDGQFYKGTNCTTAERITFFLDWKKDGEWEALDFLKN